MDTKYQPTKKNVGKDESHIEIGNFVGGVLSEEGAEIYGDGVDTNNPYLKSWGLNLRAMGLIEMNPHSGSGVEATPARRERFTLRGEHEIINPQ